MWYFEDLNPVTGFSETLMGKHPGQALNFEKVLRFCHAWEIKDLLSRVSMGTFGDMSCSVHVWSLKCKCQENNDVSGCDAVGMFLVVQEACK